MRATVLNTPGTVVALLEDALVKIAVANADGAISKVEGVVHDSFYTTQYQKNNTLQLLTRAANNIDHAYINTFEEAYADSDLTDRDFDAGAETTGRRMAFCLHCVLLIRPVPRGLHTLQPTPDFMYRGCLFPLDAKITFQNERIVAETGSYENGFEALVAMNSQRRDLFAGRIVRTLPDGNLSCVVGFMVRFHTPLDLSGLDSLVFCSACTIVVRRHIA